jgi:hydrid cluster protein-associated redox disulfide domain
LVSLNSYNLKKKEEYTMTQVTKSTMIGELLQIDENIAPILLNIGMHCLGCPSSQMETIEEAAMVHGIEADALVKEINDFLAKDLAAN